ncbi:MAG TPA: Zn-dependent alcohol dehydrogenase [Acidimicrobiia bacterium]|nr:Zn-dependent alcohol dehydrogenase [Acidimicrobiia bacterium]
MRAAVLHECPGWLDITDLDVGSIGPREVLVQTQAAGLCHSDLHCIEGTLPVAVPVVLGHESAGVVEAVGSDVTDFRPGDRVIACTSAACGLCVMCSTGRPNMCQSPPRRPGHLDAALSEHGTPVAQFAGLGGFAEQMLLPEQALMKLDLEVPVEVAALVGCAVTTGLGAVFNTAKVPPGATVAVVGCGGIGLNVVQGAVVAGAARVIAVDVSDEKLDRARTFGATDTVDATAGDPVAQVRELTGGGVQYSFEALGRKETSEQAFGMLAPGGTATIIGISPFGTMFELSALDFIQEKKMQGSIMGSNRFRIDMPYYLRLYQQGRIKLDELISQRIKLDEINDGYEKLQAGVGARSVIVFD